MKIREADVLRACEEYLQLRGYFAWRNNTGAVQIAPGRFVRFGKPGSPDIIGIIKECNGNGRFFGIECKSSTGRQSAEQKKFEKNCVRNGGLYVLARSVDDLKEAGL